MRFAGSNSAMQSMFGNMSNYTPGVIQDLGTKALSSTKQAETEADFMTSKAGIDAEALVKGAEYGAESLKAQGKAQGKAAGHSSLMSGISSGISGIMGGIGSMGTSGGAMPASSTMSGYNYSDFGNSMNANPFASSGSISNFGLKF